MKMKNVGKQVIDEVEYGVYVWKMPDGRYVGDDQGNFLSINSMRGDLQKMAALRSAVSEFAITEGEPHFLSGHRKVDDEEYERQKERMESGLIPDELDAPAYADELRGRRDKRSH